MADWVEPMVRGQASDMADRMEPTVQEHTTRTADQEVPMVRVERAGLLKVEDKVGHADEDAEDSVDLRGRKSHIFPFTLAHTGGCAG